MNTVNTYPIPAPSLAEKFAQAEVLRQWIDAHKGYDPSLWATIVNRLRTDWTYHSNGIEGSILTRGQTHFFLTEGLTAQGKPFKDFLDAQNHAEAIDLLFDAVAGQQPITESFIKQINALILRGVEFTPAKNALGLKVQKKANPSPLHVPDEMQTLIQWVNINIHNQNPIHVAAIANYNMVRIHPFDDGNGRGARILMNLILMHKGYFPAVVRLEEKPAYLQSLAQADQGDLIPFIGFITDTVIATQQSVVDALEKRNNKYQ